MQEVRNFHALVTMLGLLPANLRSRGATMLDAGADLRDAQIAARHADPRTTMRYDRARKNLWTGTPIRFWLHIWHRAPEPIRATFFP